MSFSTGGQGTDGPWVQYAGNDSTDEFALAHKIYDESDIVVLLTVDATNVTTIQTITTHYTVADVATDAHDTDTPTITMVTPPATGETLTLYRVGDLIQNTTFATTAFWRALPAEKQLDLMVMDAQWLYMAVYKRGAFYALSNPDTPPTLEALLAASSLIAISDLTGKGSIVAADLLRVGDSADSFAEKSITGTNLVTFLATLFLKNPMTANLDTGGFNILFDTATGILDSNGLEQLLFVLVADAVNELTITNAATGNAPSLAATGGDTNIDFELAAKGTGAIKLLNYLNMNSLDIDNAKAITFIAEVDNGNSGAADTIDFGAGQKQFSTLTDDCTFTFTAPDGPGNFLLRLVQGGAGSYTVTWPTIKWVEGLTPTLSTAVGAEDIITIFYNGTSYYASASKGFAVP